MNLETSRSNHVRDIHVRTDMADEDVNPPIAPAAADDIAIGLRWGTTVRGRRSVGEEWTAFALDFGDDEAAAWQQLGGSNLWIGSTADGHLAGLVGRIATVPARAVGIEFSSSCNFEASLHGERSFDIHSTSPRARAEEAALHDAWLVGGDQALHDAWVERDEEVPPPHREAQHLKSADGTAGIGLDADGAFDYFSFSGPITQGEVALPESSTQSENISVKSAWPASVAVVSDTSDLDQPKVEVRINGLVIARWHALGEDGPWIGVSDGDELARIVVTGVRREGGDEDEDLMGDHSPEGMAKMMAEQEARQDDALERLDFPVYGMAGEWDRERTASIEADGEQPPGVAAVELDYGTQRDLTLPYVEVRTSNEPWRLMALRHGSGTEFAHDCTGWLSHLTRLPVEGHESRAEAAEWFAEGQREEQELAQRPWEDRSILVGGELMPFKLLSHRHGWVARGVVEDLVVDIKALHLLVEDVALAPVNDLGPFIAGRKQQIAEITEKQQEWETQEGAPDWANEARKGAARATQQLLGGLMDSDLQRVVGLMSEDVVKRYGGRAEYRSMLSLYMGARGFCGWGSSSHAWVNEDGTLVGAVASLSLVPDEPDDGGMTMTSSVPRGADDPSWWGLSDRQVNDAVSKAAEETDALDDELPIVVMCQREGDDFKIVSDLIEQLADKLGSPVSLVQPK